MLSRTGVGVASPRMRPLRREVGRSRSTKLNLSATDESVGVLGIRASEIGAGAPQIPGDAHLVASMGTTSNRAY
jgi:hypothetical protein